MFDLAYIPPMSTAEQSKYEFYINQDTKYVHRSASSQRNFLRLIFIHQANALKSLAEDDIDSIADPAYARLAIESYNAYLEYSSKLD